MPESNRKLAAALEYLAKGLSVVPMRENGKKAPYIKWSDYKRRLATENELRRGWTTWPEANVGAVLGQVSGNLIVLDCDSEEAERFVQEQGIPPTWICRTRRGHHYYFRVPSGRTVRKLSNLGGIRGLDLLAESSIVTLPPSRHVESNQEYLWITGPDNLERPAEVPSWILTQANRRGGVPGRADVQVGGCGGQEIMTRALNGFSEGERNLGLSRLAGSLLSRGLSQGTVAGFLLIVNQRNRPPLPSQEVHQIAASIWVTHQRGMEAAASLDFPQELLTGLAGDFAELYSTYLESPPSFLFMSFFSCLGSILGRALTIDTELRPEPRLYTVLIGESGDTKKSTAINKTVDFFKAALSEVDASEDDQDDVLGGRVYGLNICRGVGSGEGLQEAFKHNEKLLLIFDEFRVFVDKARIKNSSLLPCVNTLFESVEYANRTKKSNVELDDVHLSILAASTTETWDQCWHSSFTAIGFNNRLFLVPGRGNRRFPVPRTIPEEEKGTLACSLRRLLREFEGLRLGFTGEALQIYESWYLALDDSPFSKRLDTYALRFMSLIALNDGVKEINRAVVEKVLALCNWQRRVREIYSPIDSETTIGAFEEKIRRALKGEALFESQLKRKVNYARHGSWYFMAALKNLEEIGEVRKVGRGKRVQWQMV